MLSGSTPWDMVRLPWGSMSQQRTRWPSSAKATARLRVVVVFATPPFWLANAMTLAFDEGVMRGLFALGPAIPPMAPRRRSEAEGRPHVRRPGSATEVRAHPEQVLGGAQERV